jgi:hypothetical protein
MKSDDWQKVKEIFDTAVDLPAGQRARFLADKCGRDAELRKEVDSLLASYKPEFLDDSPTGKIIELITDRLSIEQTIGGRYLILDRLGKGGMGEVYLARDLKLGRPIALKVLTEELSQDKNRLKDFEDEAQKVSRLNSDNIVKVYDFDEADGISFITTEYVEGVTLRQKMQASRLNLDAFFDLSLQLAAALEAAHQNSIVHRDIKPENIMIDEKGRVKILDFGIARLNAPENPEALAGAPFHEQTERASGFGSINYMSPEQIKKLYSEKRNDVKIDHRSDIWSLGVCMYEMLEGRRPFTGDNQIDKAASILKDDAPSLGIEVPEEIEKVVRQALQKNREDRYQSIGTLRAELKALQTQPIFGRIDTFREWRHSRGMNISRALIYGWFAGFMICVALSLYYPGIFKLVRSTSNITQMTAQNFQVFGSIFHLLLIFAAAAYFYRNPGPESFRDISEDVENERLKPNIILSTGYKKIDDWKTAREIAEDALQGYRDTFFWLLCAWFTLYLFVIINYFVPENNTFATALTLANNLNTICLWLCYRLLDEPIGTGNRTLEGQDIKINAASRRKNVRSIIVFAVLVFWVLLEFGLGDYLSPENRADAHKISRLVSGLFGGTAMALFVGRFQSKFLKSPQPLLIFLYLYTVIQTLFLFFGDNSTANNESDILKAAVIQSALLLKCLLILYMFWLFQSGRLLFYLVRVRRADNQIETEWQNFREVLKREQ